MAPLEAFVRAQDTEREDECSEYTDEGESGVDEAGDGDDGVTEVTELPLEAIRRHSAVVGVPSASGQGEGQHAAA